VVFAAVAAIVIAIRPTSSSAPDIATSVSSASVIADASPEPIDAATVRDAGRPDAEAVHTPHATAATEARAAPISGSSRIDTPATPERTLPAGTAGSGWLRIVAGCAAARAGSVAVDGHPSGDHVPTTLRVSAGSHRVRVVAADGTVFDGDVEVTAFHTEGSPAWFRACDP
jgi:hypothetical protein